MHNELYYILYVDEVYSIFEKETYTFFKNDLYGIILLLVWML